MSFVQMRDQVVSIITGTVPTTKIRGLPDRFVFVPSARRDGGIPESRGFWLELISVTDKRLLRPAHTLWTSARFMLLVAYRTDVDGDKLLEAQIADYRALNIALLDDANWGRPSSSITKIGDPGFSLSMEVERVDGAQLMSIELPIDFT